LLRNPRGFGRQVILDIAVTRIDGQSRSSDDRPEQPLQVRYDQKMAKYGWIADENTLQFAPTVFSHTGQIHDAFKSLIKEQIRQKLVSFEGRTKQSKVRSTMKWRSKCLSIVIAKTAGRDVAFKVSKMGEPLLAAQPVILTRETPELFSSLHDEEALVDLGYNTYLYIFN